MEYKNEFRKIDSEAKAYFLGFFHADGNLHYSAKAYSSASKIKLSIKDEELLKRFEEEFPYFKFSYTKDSYKWKAVTKISYKCLLRSYNKELFKDLLNLNVKEDFPDVIPKHLRYHFIRGLIDGDGSFSISSKQNNKLYYTMDLSIANKYLIDKFIKWLPSNINPTFQKDGKIFRIRIRRRNDLINLIDYLYTNANWYLQRKYDKAQEIRKYYLAPNKSGELLENPEADNQQPSSGSAKSTEKVQRLDGEQHKQ